MKLRLVPWLAALLLTSCASPYFLKTDAYLAIKRVALVQYAINPAQVLGTGGSEEARQQTAQKAWELFTQSMANHFEVIPFTLMTTQPAYASSGGSPSSLHFVTAPGALFFSSSTGDTASATLPPETARRLCEGLGVDAVVAITDQWGLAPYAVGFRAHSANLYTIAMYDRTGERIWTDRARGESEEGMSLTAGVVSAEVATYVLNNGQAFNAALASANARNLRP